MKVTFKLLTKFIFLNALLLMGQFAHAQNIQSGPILFHNSQDEYAIWYMTKGNIDAVSDELHVDNQVIPIDTSSIMCEDRSCVFKYTLPKSSFANKDSLIVRLGSLNNVAVLRNPTLNEKSYLLGSCAFNWTQFGRLFFPGNGFRIFNKMKSVENSGMIWMGDNLYYLFRQTSSLKNMYSKQKRIRKNRFINAFLRSTVQTAIWDDHDYGPNNSDASFKNKNEGIKVFQSFWPAPYPEDQQQGNYYTLSDEYAKYYYLDDRFFKSADFNHGMFGPQQIEWLKEELKKSDKAFNIIISGSQMINDIGNQERFPEFEYEFANFFDFLNEEKIEGIFFLSGDVHYSALYQRNNLCSYPIHEFTCSPLSSFPNKVGKKDPNYNNEYMINEKLYSGQCFGKMTFNNSSGHISCNLALYDGKAELVWEHQINSEDLKIKR